MNCKITGYDYKTLDVTISPDETFYAERGSIIFADYGLERQIAFNSGNNNGGLGAAIFNTVKAKLSGESVLIVKIHNPTALTKKLLIAGSQSGLIPIKLENESIVCRRKLYVGSTKMVSLNINFKLSGIFGGVGLFQKISGEGTVFLDTRGNYIQKTLEANDCIEVDEDHLVALQGMDDYQISANWSAKNILGGEGMSLLRITGPGTVYLSPLPFLFLPQTDTHYR